MEGDRREEYSVPREGVKEWQMRRTSNEWVMESCVTPYSTPIHGSGQCPQ